VADVAVVTDGTASLPAAPVDSLGITVVSLDYDLGGGRLRESEFDGDCGRFFAELDASKCVAPTSPPTVEDFVVVFDRLLQQLSAVVSVLISSGVSDTCSAARQAAAQLDGAGGERVVVIDPGAAGHLGLEAAARAAAGLANLRGVIERVRQEVRQWFLVDRLEYLRRGGWIGAAAAWLAPALNLKPILMIGSENGEVERVRTRWRRVERLVALMRQRARWASIDGSSNTHMRTRTRKC
jgi:DegV family protein with EDD domain